MKSFLPFPFFFLLLGICQAQNLVPNGSFEEYDACPTGINQVDTCKYWFPFGGIYGVPGSPDYFNVCALSIASIPDNAFGTQPAYEGNAYMGLYTFEYSYGYREYIGTSLLDTMQPGKHYSVSMRISRGNLVPGGTDATVASNKMGMRLTTLSYPPGSILPVNNSAQLYEDSIIVDSVNWVLLHWNFIADSAYTHVYIGNFFDSDHTDTLRVEVIIPPGRAYYFIDSVSINCTDCVSTSMQPIPKAIGVIYNGYCSTLELCATETTLLTVVNETGEMLFCDEISAGKRSIPFAYSSGIYLIVLQTRKGVMVKKILIE
ncbi:MAG: T9SS type A sorting domain-containing protein [Chitinophagaceae bacterium]|nr:T9SS type A sorting domain-containing protein [Chitinophagaceae bacterium]